MRLLKISLLIILILINFIKYVHFIKLDHFNFEVVIQVG